VRQLSHDDLSTVPSGRTVILAQVVALLGKKELQERKQAYNMLDACCRELIKRYFIVKWGCDEDRAEDLCQDTFVRVWRYLDKFLPENARHLNNWLYKIASDVAIDDYRREESRGSQSVSDGEVYTRLAEPAVEGEAEQINERLIVQEVIQQVPQMERACLVLKYYYGWTQKKIAEKLGIGESTVSMLVNSGRAELRKTYHPVTVDIRHMEEIRLQREFNRIYRTYNAALNDEILIVKNETMTEEEFIRCSKLTQWSAKELLRIEIEMSKIVTVESEADIDIVLSEREEWSKMLESGEEPSVLDMYILHKGRIARKLRENYHKEL
jgi:RNA polymerase sigma-70 factor, ECF subfamily